MKSYIVYEPDSGKILRTGICPDDVFYLQAGEGESVRAGEARDDEQMINPFLGTIIPKPIPPPYVPTLEEVKESKMKEIKAAFEAAFFLGYTTQSLTQNFKIDCKRDDKENLESLLKRMRRLGIATTIIRDFNNEFHFNVTASEVEAIIDELIDYGLWLYSRKWELEVLVEAAESVSAVEAASW